MKNLSQRLLSIDAFRSLTMLTMIFVNDVSGVSNIPAWIEHTKAADDGMGFADTVFPAFLFIVGLSIPFAIGKRIARQESFIKTEGHILTRSLALIVMGFFHVNLESYDSGTAILPYAIWEILITIGFFLIWMDYKKKQYLLQGIGIALLLAMAALYKGEGGQWMRPSWWGILGIIGWAYLVSATVFLLVKGKFPALLVLLAVFLAINFAKHSGLLTLNLPVIGDASSITLIMAGVVISAMPQKAIGLLLGIGVAAISLGLIVRPYTEGISKIRSTPSWVLICAGISTVVFALMIWLVDRKGKMHWFSFIKPAGTSTLTCYLVPYLLYSLMLLAHFQYPEFLSSGIGGILRSIAVALIVIWIAGRMEKVNLRLKI
jgi:predicted acyltransferase